MVNVDVSAIWRDYKRTKNPDAREALIGHYIRLAKWVADRIYVKASGYLTKDDLMSETILGLIECIERFDPDREVKFETYAVKRIRGAVIDMLRRRDWAPRSLRKMEKTIRETYERLEGFYGRSPKDEEMADAMGMSLDDFQSALADISQLAIVSLEEQTGSFSTGDAPMTLEDRIEGGTNPIDMAMISDKKRILTDAIERLTERERMVVNLYYYEGLTLKEVGSLIGVTEARVSQIHAKAVMRLHNTLTSFETALC